MADDRGTCPSCKGKAAITRDLQSRVHTITCADCGVFTVCSWCHTLALHETPDGNIVRLNSHGQHCRPAREAPSSVAPRRASGAGD